MQITNKMNENRRLFVTCAFFIFAVAVLLALGIENLSRRLRVVEQQLQEHITYKPE